MGTYTGWPCQKETSFLDTFLPHALSLFTSNDTQRSNAIERHRVNLLPHDILLTSLPTCGLIHLRHAAAAGVDLHELVLKVWVLTFLHARLGWHCSFTFVSKTIECLQLWVSDEYLSDWHFNSTAGWLLLILLIRLININISFKNNRQVLISFCWNEWKKQANALKNLYRY